MDMSVAVAPTQFHLLDTADVRITIGICAYNEERNIANVLKAITPQISSTDEIIVVASGCTDSTVKVVRAFDDKRILLIEEDRRRGKAAAVNQILKYARGEYIFLLSADTVPSKKAVSLMTSEFSNQKVAVTIAHPVPTNHKVGLIGYLAHLYWRLHDRTLRTLSERGELIHGGELMAVRKSVVEKLPAEVVNDDAYLEMEAGKRGYELRYCPDALVYMKAPNSLFELITQRRRVLYGHYQLRDLTGIYPHALEPMLYHSPMTVAKVLHEELREYPTLRFLAALGVELIANSLAQLDRFMGRGHAVWRALDSTKSVLE
jgi:cellulose synthase/poly-beta-1,6-N-acetylglucosamine synthase-like glycosyltransferase